MSERDLEFRASMPILKLENLYRKAYEGHEADIRFRPTEENCLHFIVRIRVPHMIAVNKEASKRFESVLKRLTREAAYECGRMAAEFSEPPND